MEVSGDRHSISHNIHYAIFAASRPATRPVAGARLGGRVSVVTYLAPLSPAELGAVIGGLCDAIDNTPGGAEREELFRLLQRLRCLRDAIRPPSSGHTARL